MIFIDGLWWPESDKHCRKVVCEQVIDADKAVRYARGHSLCLQAGGNCGIWAAHLAKTFEEVWTVEADLENYLCLVRNVPVNVKTVWAALGAEPGTTGIRRDPANAGAHYIEGEGHTPVIRIDDLNLPACELIILDIEGMEPAALDGASKTIEKFKPVIMVEDKGLSQKYGHPAGWAADFADYRLAGKVHRDVILVPE